MHTFCSYTVATINFSFLMSTFFNRANSAAAAGNFFVEWSIVQSERMLKFVGGILFFVSYLPYNMLLMWEEELSWYHILSGVSPE